MALEAKLQEWHIERAEFGRQLVEKIEDEVRKEARFRAEAEAEILRRLEAVENRLPPMVVS